MSKKDVDQEYIWEVGWEGHNKEQMQRMANLSFMEKIKWLEEAQEIVNFLKNKNCDP